jgi:hypothetical protein
MSDRKLLVVLGAWRRSAKRGRSRPLRKIRDLQPVDFMIFWIF